MPMIDSSPAKETATAGMWVFLTSEIMFFGVLFSAYVIYARLNPETFAQFSKRLHLMWGTVNTAVLLSSSLTMVLAVQGAQQRQRRKILLFLGLTFILGWIFLGIKGFEWFEEILGGNLPRSSLFLSLYFTMTGFHGLHVLIGLFFIGGLWFH